MPGDAVKLTDGRVVTVSDDKAPIWNPRHWVYLVVDHNGDARRVRRNKALDAGKAKGWIETPVRGLPKGPEPGQLGMRLNPRKNRMTIRRPPPEEPPVEPDEEDIVVSDNGREAFYAGKLIAEIPRGSDYPTGDLALEIIDWMDRSKYWPAVWYADDHGGWHPWPDVRKDAAERKAELDERARVEEERYAESDVNPAGGHMGGYSVESVEPIVNAYRGSEDFGKPYGIRLWFKAGSRQDYVGNLEHALANRLTKKQREYMKKLISEIRGGRGNPERPGSARKSVAGIAHKIEDLKDRLRGRPPVENFGDREIRELDDYVGDQYGYPYDQRLEVFRLKRGFSDWCADYTGEGPKARRSNLARTTFGRNPAPVGHTPGPWKPIAYGQTVSIRSMAPGEWDVAQINAGGDYDKGIPSRRDMANARLIAAAPDLLRALEAAMEFRDSPKVEEIMDFARKAVREARGGTARGNPAVEHTPGPWESGNGEIWCPESGQRIAWMGISKSHGTEVPNDEQLANAELVAAAPELLSSVERMLPWIGKLIADGGHLESVLPRDAEMAMDQAQAAVDKAKGPTARSNPGRMTFETVGTGGGCEALQADIDGFYVLVTHAHDPSIPMRGDKYRMGLYDKKDDAYPVLERFRGNFSAARMEREATRMWGNFRRRHSKGRGD